MLISIAQKRAILDARRSINIIWQQLENKSGHMKEPNRREADWAHIW